MQSPITREHVHLDHTLLAVDGGADGVQATRRPPANHFFHFDGICLAVCPTYVDQ